MAESVPLPEFCLRCGADRDRITVHFSSTEGLRYECANCGDLYLIVHDEATRSWSYAASRVDRELEMAAKFGRNEPLERQLAERVAELEAENVDLRAQLDRARRGGPGGF